MNFDFDWWMEDPPSLEPVQRWISSWLWLEVDAHIFWEPILEKGSERPRAECVRDGRDFFGQKGRIHLKTNINDTT